MKKIAFAATAAALLWAAPAAAADTCTLTPAGSLAMTVLADGQIAVPVTINGGSHAMLLDLAVSDSAVSDALASKLYLYPDRFPHRGVVAWRGGAVSGTVTVGRLQLGAMSADQFTVLLLVPGTPLPPDVAGVLGLGLLKNSDLDIDFAGGKVNLFSPRHCEGAVVYWSDTAAVVPFEINEQQRLVFQMELDGKPVSVSFGEGAGGRMSLGAFRRVFGTDASAGTAGGNDASGGVLYDHAFQTLSVGGITLRNPAIALVDDTKTSPCRLTQQPLECLGRSDLEIGFAQLKALHLYFAFGEKKLYATAAGAHK
jgi:hypothetical protein